MDIKECRKILEKKMESAGKEFYRASGKGDGYFVRGSGYVSYAKARKIFNVPMYEKRERMQQVAYGDYATIAMINGIKI